MEQNLWTFFSLKVTVIFIFAIQIPFSVNPGIYIYFLVSKGTTGWLESIPDANPFLKLYFCAPES